MGKKLTAIGVAASFALSGCNSGGGPKPSEQTFDAIAASSAIVLIGTEPFWRMDIEPSGSGYSAAYSTPEDVNGTRFAVERFAGNNGLGFSGTLASQQVQVAVTAGECSDGMSDRIYLYIATVSIDGDIYEGCGYTDADGFSGGEGS